MDTSDDPITLLLIGGAVAGGVAVGGAFSGGGGGGDINLPSTQAATTKKTAPAVDRGSETAKRNRQRRRGGLGADLGELTLGTPGLFGGVQGF